MKILNADPQPVFREGIRHLLQTLAAEIEFYQADSVQTVLDTLYVDDDLDLILFDLDLLNPDDLSRSLRAIKAAAPKIPLVVLASSTQLGDVEAIMATGVAGFISKSSSTETLLRAVRRVLSGGHYPPRGAQRACYDALKRLSDAQSQLYNANALSLPVPGFASTAFFSATAVGNVPTLAH